MTKIEELSQTLANQIAAGEVVERPASVVKELVENAIDANSTQIDIYLEESGLKKIQVVDNGDGIEAEDVLNAFKRHATSKIHSRDDLFRIRSLGFRGEALPSIASVSEVTLETSTGEGDGSYLFLSGGAVKENKPHSLRKGTSITVENLFFNTPARLKYVKTLQTELANIGDIVNRLAMSHPNVAFRLMHDGNRMLVTAGNGDLKQTIAGIYGVATAKKMLPIKSEDLDFRLSGYISLPEVTRASRNYLSLIINGRYIKNYVLNKAIIEGYGSKLMVGRFPLVVLQIDMDPLLVDVNVHPTKQEVRLSKEKDLVVLIREAIKDVLSDQVLIPNASDSAPYRKRMAPEEKVEQLNFDFSTPKPTFQKNERTIPSDLAYDKESGDFYLKHSSIEEIKETNYESKPTVVPEVEIRETPSFQVEETTIEVVEPKNNMEDSVTQTEVFPDLEYFGQMHGTYLFAQNKEGLFIIDQHAAQERIKYEYFREKIGDVSTNLQELLVPIVLEYSADDLLRIKENQHVLEEVGIYLEDFGNNSLIVRAHPTWYISGQEESIIREMIDIFLETGKADVAKFREDTAIMMSCKRSIKANHYLDEKQARALLEDLKTCENPFNCPHGRPVLIRFTNNDMEKMFKRIQDPH
ncbi:MAG: DNA mismatch repair endonuclease MutL [Vagococcus sp.]|uniref:DNA mismatch repair endonuclease MutL n=1 Tax=Vagococcus sp. TaxID=1933889 RepID=UPI002FC5C819